MTLQMCFALCSRRPSCTLPCAFPLANGVYLYLFSCSYGVPGQFTSTVVRLPYRWFCRPSECFRFVRMLVIPTLNNSLKYYIVVEL